MDEVLKEVVQKTNSTMMYLVLMRVDRNDPKFKELGAKMDRLQHKVEQTNSLLKAKKLEIDNGLKLVIDVNNKLKYLKTLRANGPISNNVIQNNIVPLTPCRPPSENQVYDEEMATPGFNRSLAQPLEDTPYTESPSQNEENGLPVKFITDEEFQSVKPYMKGRLKLEAVNEVVDVFNRVLTQKYEYYQCQRNKLRSNEKIFEIYPIWKEQQKNHADNLICTEQDIFLLANLKLTKKEYNIIAIIRHLKRLRQDKIKDKIFFIIN